MQSAKSRIFVLGTFGFLMLFSLCVSGQSYRFRNFGTGKIPDPYINTINQDNNGFLWVGTGTVLAKFDGFNFYTVNFPDSVTNRYATVSLKDKKGNLWFGCSDGTLFYTSDGMNLKRFSDLNVQSINSIIEDKDGYIWIIPQDHFILKINENKPDEIVRFGIRKEYQMTSASLAPDNKILIGTQDNLLYCSLGKDSVNVESVVKGIEYSKVQTIQPVDNNGKFLVGINGAGLFKLDIINNRPFLGRFLNHPELESIEVTSIMKDHSDCFWITYSAGVYQMKLSKTGDNIESLDGYTSSSGLPGDNVRTVFQDLEENIWIGFYGDGLSMLSSSAFSFYPISDKPALNSIIYIGQLNNRYLLGTPSGYYIFSLKTGKAESFINLEPYIQQRDILSFFLDTEKRLWIGTKGGGVYSKNPDGSVSQFYRSGNNSEDNIINITSDGRNIWLSTLGGVIILDKNSGKVIKKYQTDDRLPHNSINEVFIKNDGGALVATECDRLYDIRLNSPISIGKGILAGSFKNKVLCFTETNNGEIGAGTYGNGVFLISNDSVTRITTENGLLTNYCYSIMADSDNKIWIGHERGFSRYDINTGIIKNFTNDFARGGNCNPNAMLETSDGKILIGTTEGLIYYDRTKERKNIKPPINNILAVTINKEVLPFQKIYTLSYKKRYNVTIDYVGIDLSDPEKVYYRTKLDNYDTDWSRLKFQKQSDYALSDGKYTFNLISVSEDGLSEEKAVTFEIFIKKPLWRTWWFFLLSFAVVSGVVYAIIYIREKSQREMNEYLEAELAERTRVVLKQKDEIELQNIEITDSINYAKRIQSSILPDINKIKESFNDAFIIFHPRDIVSGDFYWFDKLDSDRFIIVCADSTGHGVPGAFMSMIGSTLLQDIITRKGVTRPSEILKLLDKEIFSTLNQNIDVGVSNDGMDMVVCEFNVKTRHVRFASAMRPVIIVLEGESYYIRGNRCSVGGESVMEKYFDDQEYFMSKGDTIYLFSDGLPDQFGGPDGKKMKIARLKKLIEEVSGLSMDEQKEVISNYFFDWKADYEQVDDILMMGIKV
jgi:ligand-binding sensor domain-containing protein/serine phosphatase RsbU (regulator of sigma subunit)